MVDAAPPSTPVQRLDSLTSLRFVAAAAVVIYHLVAIYAPTSPLVALTGSGFVGVSFFFVLSGFVLTWSARGASARTFYWLRFARIFPLHLITALLALWLLGPWPPRQVVPNLVLLQAWDYPGGYYTLNAPSWTLSCEAFFYALFPLLLLVLVRIGRPLTALAVTVAASVGAAIAALAVLSEPVAFWFTYISPIYRVGEFIAGMCLALAFQRGLRLSRHPAWGLLLVAAPIAVLTILGYGSNSTGYSSPVSVVHALVALPGVMFLIVAAASQDVRGRTSSALTHPWFVRLGTWSFAVYMTHQLIMKVVAEHGLSAWAGAVISLALVVPVAAFFHIAFERPIERSLRRLVIRPSKLVGVRHAG